jgi:AsmA protein
VLTQASFSAGIAGTPKNARLDNLSLKLDQTAATGWVAVRDFASQAIDFALKADAIDADRYLAPPDAAPAPTAEGKGSDRKGDFRKTEIPVAALEGLNASGTLELRSLKLKGLALTNIRVVLSALKGRPKTQEMTASLYGGRITQSARMVRNSPVRYDLKLGLDAIESAPLLKDLLGKSYLSGLGKFNLNVNSGGGTVGDVLRALSGAVSTGFSNGAVEGFNLAQTLENAKALARGETAQETGPKRTEFKDLSAAGKITNGVLATDTLNVKGSWYQLGGDGKINLVEQTLNYTLYPTVTAGDKLKELQGTRIPVAVTGSWFAPKVKVDLAGVVKGRVKQELQKQEEKVKDKAREKLGDFLRKQTEPAPQPKPKQPAATPPPPAGEGTQPAPAGQPEEPPPAEQQPAPSS